MRYLADDLTQVMGIGQPGTVRQGPDGGLYQWSQTVDGLGNPVGFWKKLRRIGRRVHAAVRQAAPVIQRVAPFVPGGAAVTGALRTVGVEGHGVGALYQAEDGTVYAGNGIGQEENELDGVALGSAAPGMGQLGELRADGLGNLYEWVEGIDGLGQPFGFWKRLKKAARGLRNVVRHAMPIVQQVAPFVPGGAAVSSALRTAQPFLRQAGVADDGSEIDGLHDGSDAYDDIQGLHDDTEGEEVLDGFADGEYADDIAGCDCSAIADDLGEEQELDGYYADNDLRGIDAYSNQTPARAPAPDIWKPLW